VVAVHGSRQRHLFNGVIALVQALVTVMLAALLLDVPLRWSGFPLLVAAVAVGTAGWFFFYAIFALLIRRNDAFNTVTSIFYFVFLFASSMFYPVDPLPTVFRMAAAANPITWQVDVLRYATIGLGSPSTLLVQSGLFLAFTAVCFAGALTALRRQE
jgi:ABC-2 type transport system permease protein